MAFSLADSANGRACEPKLEHAILHLKKHACERGQSESDIKRKAANKAQSAPLSMVDVALDHEPGHIKWVVCCLRIALDVNKICECLTKKGHRCIGARVVFHV